MIHRKFSELARDLRARRREGEEPPVLLLGAGASVDSGIGAMSELFQFLDVPDFDAFCSYIAATSVTERYRYLAQFLQTRTPSEASPGYRALASLCALNYFNLVLTTNMDPLLDDALAAARLWRRDYLLIVNGVIRLDRLEQLLHAKTPRVKIVKLHGDLFQPFMAWTVQEMDAFLGDVSPYLTPAVRGRDFLVVGYSLRDARVRELVESTGGVVWFTHPQAVPDHLGNNAAMRAVVAPECSFERFFPALAQALEVDVKEELPDPGRSQLRSRRRSTEGAYTMDDLMSSVFAVAAPGGTSSSTCFLLAGLDVVVCDRFAIAPLVRNGEVDLIAPGGRTHRARVLRANDGHPFGPALLERPASLHAPGLRLSRAPLAADSTIQVLVAAGERVGISTGRVAAAAADALRIDPIDGKVPDLARLNCLVAPGSSGAPVVNESMAVSAFIVAGSTDETNPTSYCYPASCWAGFADAAPAVRGGSRGNAR